jgi:two-component system alkaline phosphatase synthesis response regulator PhoP
VATILAVDKDPLQLELLSFLLKQEGHKVHATPEPDQALDLLQNQLIDLVILEISLQRHDGMRVCQQMRQINPYTPLMIVSERPDEDLIIRGLMMAADDYVIKPFSPRQLLARVHAHLRRANLNRSGRWSDENLSIGEISLNLQQAQAVVNGHRVALTQREFSLLYALMENAGRVLSRDQLTELAWDHFAGTQKSVDVYVQRLRKKLQPHLDGREYIQALRGFGYKFEMPRPQAAASY